MSGIIAHEWLNENALRNYPFSEAATLISTEGIEFPPNVIVDLFVAAPASVTYPCRIAQISFTGRLLSIVIRDAADVFLAAATVDIEQEGEFITEPLKSPVFNSLGSVTLGPDRAHLPSLLPTGNQSLGLNGGLLEPTTCPPLEAGPVTSLGVFGNTVVLRGDVKLIAGSNISLSYNLEENSIIVALDAPAQYENSFKPECNQDCVPGQCLRTPITRINGVTGTGDGACAFFIEGAGVIDVGELGGAILVTSDTVRPADLCSKYTTAPDGKPGLPGPPGGPGLPGKLICGQADCFCQVCDLEAAIPEDDQVLKPPQKKFGVAVPGASLP